MTVYDPNSKGEQVILTPEERAAMQRSMGDPSDYPPQLGAWVDERVRARPPDLFASQIKGSRGVPRYLYANADSLASTSTSYVDFARFTLPGKSLAKTGVMRMFLVFEAMCADVSNTLRIQMVANGVDLTVNDLDQEILDSSLRSGFLEFTVINLGSYQSNFFFTEGQFHRQSDGDEERSLRLSGSNVVWTLDTAQDCDVRLQARWFNAGSQNFVKRYVSVEVFNPLGIS